MLHARSTVITWISYPVQFPRRSESNEREKLFLANAKRTKRKKSCLTDTIIIMYKSVLTLYSTEKLSTSGFSTQTFCEKPEAGDSVEKA